MAHVTDGMEHHVSFPWWRTGWVADPVLAWTRSRAKATVKVYVDGWTANERRRYCMPFGRYEFFGQEKIKPGHLVQIELRQFQFER